MPRFTTLLLLFLFAAFLAACVGSVIDRPPGGSGSAGKQCTAYSERQVSENYCEREAAQSCRTYCDSSGCRTTCGGGGYCASYASRMVTVNECTDYVCDPGLIRAEGGCFTGEQLEARREWRVGRALRLVSERWDVPSDSAAAYSHAANAFRYGYNGLPIDKQLSYEYAQEGCNRGSSLACLTLAELIGSKDNPGYLNDDGSTQGFDPILSKTYRQQSCDMGYAAVCVDIATEWLEPMPVTGDLPARSANPERARNELIQICNRGEPLACDRIASFYIGGEFASDTPHQDALRYYQQSCSKPDGSIAVTSCMEATKLLFTGAEDLSRNVEAARKIARRVYDQDPDRIDYDDFLLCVIDGGRFCGLSDAQIGELPMDGQSEAALGDGKALLAAAAELQNRPNASQADRALAFDYLNQSCELGEGGGCGLLAQVLWYQDQYKDRAAARAIWDRACDLGDGVSCNMLGKINLYGQPVFQIADALNRLAIKSLPSFADPTAGKTYLERGCELRHLGSCSDAARLALQTETPGYERNLRARTHFLRACELGDSSYVAESCVAAALMIYSDRWGLTQDRNAAWAIVDDAKRFADSEYYFNETGITWRDKTAACILAKKAECG